MPTPMTTVAAAVTTQNSSERPTTPQNSPFHARFAKLSKPTHSGGWPNCWASPYFWNDVTTCQMSG